MDLLPFAHSPENIPAKTLNIYFKKFFIINANFWLFPFKPLTQGILYQDHLNVINDTTLTKDMQ